MMSLDTMMASSSVQIQFDSLGKPIPPPSCEIYRPIVESMSTECIANVFGQLHDAYETTAIAMCDSMPTAAAEYKQKCAEIRAYMKALSIEMKPFVEVKIPSADEREAALQELKEMDDKLYDSLDSGNIYFEEQKRTISKFVMSILQYTPEFYPETKLGKQLAEIIQSYPNDIVVDLMRGAAVIRLASITDRSLWLGLIDEVCDVTHIHWTTSKRNVLVLASNCAAVWSNLTLGYSKSKVGERMILSDGSLSGLEEESVNFNHVKSVLLDHMKRLTMRLESIEAYLRRSGEMKLLQGLMLPYDGRDVLLRQDRDDILGQHPQYLQFNDLFTRPCFDPNSFLHHFYPMTEEFICTLSTELQDWTRAMMHLQQVVDDNTALRQQFHSKKVDKPPTRDRLFGQPYLVWLLHVAKIVNPSFHAKVRSLLPEWYTGKGDPTKNKIKGILRCIEKVKEDYSDFSASPMPTSAQLVDIVRCLVVCPSAESAKAAFEIICANFDVLRVKNGFAAGFDADASYGFRQILLNVKHADPASGMTMICEVQLNLQPYAEVKHLIHAIYSLARVETGHSMYLTLSKIMSPL